LDPAHTLLCASALGIVALMTAVLTLVNAIEQTLVAVVTPNGDGGLCAKRPLPLGASGALPVQVFYDPLLWRS